MLQKLTDEIFVVVPEAPPRYPYSNSIYIEAERSAVIDLGAGRAYEALPLEKIRLALVSHSHFDHIHGDDFFPRAAFYAGQEEAATFSNQTAYIEFHGYYKWDQYMPGISREAISDVIPLPADVHAKPGFRDFPLSGVFQDGQSFDLVKPRLQLSICLAIPGVIMASGLKMKAFSLAGILTWLRPDHGTATTLPMLAT